MGGELTVRVACPQCGGAGAREGEPWCVRCDGDGLICRTPTTADHVADLLALPPAERVARLVALLRAVPDEAVQAVDACKVARAWTRERGLGIYSRSPVYDRSIRCAAAIISPQEEGPSLWDAGRCGTFASAAEAQAATDAARLADGWVLAGRVTP